MQKHPFSHYKVKNPAAGNGASNLQHSKGMCLLDTGVFDTRGSRQYVQVSQRMTLSSYPARCPRE